MRSFFAYGEDRASITAAPGHALDLTSAGVSSWYKDGNCGAMDYTGSWIDGYKAAIVFAPPAGFQDDLIAYVKVNEAFLGPEGDPMHVQVFFEGERLIRWTFFTRYEITVCKAVLPSRSIAGKPVCRLEFHLEHQQWTQSRQVEAGAASLCGRAAHFAARRIPDSGTGARFISHRDASNARRAPMAGTRSASPRFPFDLVPHDPNRVLEVQAGRCDRSHRRRKFRDLSGRFSVDPVGSAGQLWILDGWRRGHHQSAFRRAACGRSAGVVHHFRLHGFETRSHPLRAPKSERTPGCRVGASGPGSSPALAESAGRSAGRFSGVDFDFRNTDAALAVVFALALRFPADR